MSKPLREVLEMAETLRKELGHANAMRLLQGLDSIHSGIGIAPRLSTSLVLVDLDDIFDKTGEAILFDDKEFDFLMGCHVYAETIKRFSAENPFVFTNTKEDTDDKSG